MDKFLGKKIVGWRYGEAPDSGYSYNTRANSFECGVSLAAWLYNAEVVSMAVCSAQKRQRYYYEGIIAGSGGDDEICIIEHKCISRSDFLKRRKGMIDLNNEIVNHLVDLKLRLLRAGYTICKTEKELEDYRDKHTK